MQIPWLFPDFSQYSFISLTFNKIPWLFPDFCQVWNFPDFSLTAGHPEVTRQPQFRDLTQIYLNMFAICTKGEVVQPFSYLASCPQ